jgi:hypothetical protein
MLMTHTAPGGASTMDAREDESRGIVGLSGLGGLGGLGASITGLTGLGGLGSTLIGLTGLGDGLGRSLGLGGGLFAGLHGIEPMRFGFGLIPSPHLQSLWASSSGWPLKTEAERVRDEAERARYARPSLGWAEFAEALANPRPLVRPGRPGFTLGDLEPTDN